MLIGNRVFVVRSGLGEFAGRGSRCRGLGKAALCAGMTEILHPSTGTVKFPAGAYEFLVELAAFRAGLSAVLQVECSSGT